MKMSTRALLHATETKISKKTQLPYTVGLFLEGVSTITLMLPKFVPSNIEIGEYDLILEYDSNYKNLNIVSMSQTTKK